MSTPKKQRNKEIVKLKDKKKWTLEQIGQEFNLKKQTVHEIYHREKQKELISKELSPVKA